MKTKLQMCLVSFGVDINNGGCYWSLSERENRKQHSAHIKLNCANISRLLLFSLIWKRRELQLRSQISHLAFNTASVSWYAFS